ncbi:MAG: peptide chain release factor N(5)-glutamine methyltransferase [Nitrospirota bacterium]
MATVIDIIKKSERYLCECGIANSRLEAELLLCHAINAERLDLYVNFNRHLDVQESLRINNLLERRGNREPLQYIIGTQEFWGLRFKVTEDVFIPRPETELLVESTVEIYSRLSRARTQFTILDLCTGSGCIAVALAIEIPDAQIYAIDNSYTSLKIAIENARLHGVNNRIQFICGNIFELLIRDRVDLIISNPPYISTNSISGLQPEVKDYEPFRALNGGADGLDFIRSIIIEAESILSKGNCLILEIDYCQGDIIRNFINRDIWDMEIKRDYAGIERIAILTLKR